MLPVYVQAYYPSNNMPPSSSSLSNVQKHVYLCARYDLPDLGGADHQEARRAEADRGAVADHLPHCLRRPHLWRHLLRLLRQWRGICTITIIFVYVYVYRLVMWICRKKSVLAFRSFI